MHFTYTSRLKSNIFYCGFLLLLLTGCNSVEETNKSELDNTIEQKFNSYLSQVFKRDQINGNVLIVEKGEIVHQGAYGIANFNPIDSLTLKSQFRLASVSKQFTAMGIMLLKESGKLNYDQDIKDFIPELPYDGITIRNLLNHVSGLPDYTQLANENWKTDISNNNVEKSITGNEDIIKLLTEIKPSISFKPLDQWSYSNTGYILLASIISRASGMPFEDYLHQNIFEPVGMTNTAVYKYKDGIDSDMPNRVFGFKTSLFGGEKTPNDFHFLNAAQGDGGIYSTLEDLYKWDRVLYTEKLVSKATLEEAFTPVILSHGSSTDYGFGWFIKNSFNETKTVSHSGSWVGFTTFIYREIENDNCIIVLTNNSTNKMWDIVEDLTYILHGKEIELPKLNIDKALAIVIEKQGIDQAIEYYYTLKSEHKSEYLFEEYQLNTLGYELMNVNRIDEAQKVFHLNMKEYFLSANVYDSYAEACMKLGDFDSAIKNYKLAASMDRKNLNALKQIEIMEMNE